MDLGRKVPLSEAVLVLFSGFFFGSYARVMQQKTAEIMHERELDDEPPYKQ